MQEPYNNLWMVISYSSDEEGDVFFDLVFADDMRGATDFVSAARGRYATVSEAQRFSRFVNWVDVLKEMSVEAVLEEMKELADAGMVAALIAFLPRAACCW